MADPYEQHEKVVREALEYWDPCGQRPDSTHLPDCAGPPTRAALDAMTTEYRKQVVRRRELEQWASDMEGESQALREEVAFLREQVATLEVRVGAAQVVAEQAIAERDRLAEVLRGSCHPATGEVCDDCEACPTCKRLSLAAVMALAAEPREPDDG